MSIGFYFSSIFIYIFFFTYLSASHEPIDQEHDQRIQVVSTNPIDAIEDRETHEMALLRQSHSLVAQQSTSFIEPSNLSTPVSRFPLPNIPHDARGPVNNSMPHQSINITALHASMLRRSSNTQQPLAAQTPLNCKKLSEQIVENPNATITLSQTAFIQKDKEAATIREMARCIPTPCVRWFKEKLVNASDTLALSSKILGGLCGILVTIGGCNYATDLKIFDQSTQNQVVSIAGICFVILDKLPIYLKKVKVRDELRLMSYARTEEFQHQKEDELGRGIYYTNDEIITYLKENHDKFNLLPSQNAIFWRRFFFNAMCVVESVIAILNAYTLAFFAVSGYSGLSDQNLLSLQSQEMYKYITTAMLLTCGTLYLLDKKKTELKEACEEWLQANSMMKNYFLRIENIPEKDLYSKPRYLGRNFLTPNDGINTNTPSD
ncbi:MAG: hypothetical protein HEEMFOPI_00551 [Holosporales bacterium]